jgi:phage-related protein
MFAHIQLLQEQGILLQRPYADFLRDNIHELRVRFSQTQYRVLYFFFSRDQIVLTHGFQKESQKVSETEIDRAIRYRSDWLTRNAF